jgi:hypothetical protein
MVSGLNLPEPAYASSAQLKRHVDAILVLAVLVASAQAVG